MVYVVISCQLRNNIFLSDYHLLRPGTKSESADVSVHQRH